MLTLAALTCMAQAVYFEGRGEPLEGQIAIAEVIMNRVDSNKFPDTVCGVVAEDRGPAAYDCQFSFMCDGKPEEMVNTSAAALAAHVAYVVLTGDRNDDITNGALFFHTKSVNPHWADVFTKVAVVGEHIFYRP
jgi:spore germination cell wall hydrolase CwlJ-like protein